MGEKSLIQWCDATWNPWRGCNKVSPGCAHCYMFRQQKQYGRDPSVVVRAARATFNAPLKWTGPEWEGKKVFTCSWSDWFHEDADAWRDEAWAIVKRTPHLTYQILTKRPERISQCLPKDWDGEDGIGAEGEGYEHVWFGVSAEYQRQFEERVRCLTHNDRIANNMVFVSCEPLLGPIDYWKARVADTVNWFIVGGESGGREARRFDPDWARKLIADLREEHGDDQALYGQVFVKQLGSVWARETGTYSQDSHGGNWDLWPEDLRVRQFPGVVGREAVPA